VIIRLLIIWFREWDLVFYRFKTVMCRMSEQRPLVAAARRELSMVLKSSAWARTLSFTVRTAWASCFIYSLIYLFILTKN